MSDPETRLIKNYLKVCKKLNIKRGQWHWEFVVRDRYVNGEITLADLPKAFKRSEAAYKKAEYKKKQKRKVIESTG